MQPYKQRIFSHYLVIYDFLPFSLLVQIGYLHLISSLFHCYVKSIFLCSSFVYPSLSFPVVSLSSCAVAKSSAFSTSYQNCHFGIPYSVSKCVTPVTQTIFSEFSFGLFSGNFLCFIDF